MSVTVRDRIRLAVNRDATQLPDDDITDWGSGFYAAWDGAITRLFRYANGGLSEEAFEVVDSLKLLRGKALNTTQRAALIDQMRGLLQSNPARFPNINSNVAADGMCALAMLAHFKAIHLREDENGDRYVWQLGQTQADEVKIT